MDHELVIGYVREISQEIPQNIALDIYVLCYKYYQCSPYHITFGYCNLSEGNIDLNYIAKCLMGDTNCYKGTVEFEMFVDHKYFTIINASSIGHITVCDAAIFLLPKQSTDIYETKIKWEKFEQNLQIYHQFGIHSFIIICNDINKAHQAQQIVIHHGIDVNNAKFVIMDNIEADILSPTISQIINELNEQKYHSTKQSFLMSVDGGFNIKLGKIFTGQIIRGNVKIGDQVKFVKNSLRESKYEHIGIIKSIEMFGKQIGILRHAQIGDYVGICIKFNNNNTFNARGKGLLIDTNHMIAKSNATTNFEVEFKNVNEDFLRWIVRYYDDNHRHVRHSGINERGFYPRVNCSRIIDIGNKHQGCVLKRIRLIGDNEVLDSTIECGDGRWGKGLYWEGYDAKLIFEGDIFVTTYKESRYFGSVCMSHSDTTIGYGKVVAVGNCDWNNTK